MMIFKKVVPPQKEKKKKTSPPFSKDHYPLVLGGATSWIYKEDKFRGLDRSKHEDTLYETHVNNLKAHSPLPFPLCNLSKPCTHTCCPLCCLFFVVESYYMTLMEASS